MGRGETFFRNEKKVDKEIKQRTSPEIDLTTWPFIVLGVNYNMEILISYNGKVMKWPVDRLSDKRMKALLGPGVLDFDEMRNAILYEGTR